MSGTPEGAAKTAKTIKAKYGEDYYAKIGSKGGAQNRPETRAFRKNPELARIAGAKGGRKSKRTKGESYEKEF